MLKRLLLGAFTSLALVCPAMAEIQPGTLDLIDKVDDYMSVTIDDPFCNEYEDAAGAFDRNTMVIHLCPRGTVNADDHDTVRHEVWHVIQHCSTPKGSRYLDTVMTVGSDDWNQYILGGLSYSRVQWIKESYPETHHDAELEAFAVAKNMTAAQISNLFTKICLN